MQLNSKYLIFVGFAAFYNPYPFISQAYMQAKSKGAPVVEDPDPKGLRVPERRIDIQPAEDDEDPGTPAEFSTLSSLLQNKIR